MAFLTTCRFTLARAVLAGMFATMAAGALAQPAFPAKPIRFISPFPPGGHTGAIAQLVGQKLSESWGQPVTVEGKPGASGVIAADALAKSPPDGYTIMIAINTLAINSKLMPKLPYDLLRDLIPVATLARAEFGLVLGPTVKAADLKDFIAQAKASPTPLQFGTVGTAGIGRVVGELFAIEAGLKVQQIPYKGVAQLNNDLMAGRLHYTIDPVYSYIPAIKAGTLTALAVTGDARPASLPSVPTFAEAGLPRFDAKMWFGVFLPAGTPRPIVDKYATEIARILALPEVREQLAAKEFFPFVSTPEQFGAMLRADMETYARVIDTVGIKAE